MSLTTIYTQARTVRYTPRAHIARAVAAANAATEARKATRAALCARWAAYADALCVWEHQARVRKAMARDPRPSLWGGPVRLSPSCREASKVLAALLSDPPAPLGTLTPGHFAKLAA